MSDFKFILIRRLQYDEFFHYYNNISIKILIKILGLIKNKQLIIHKKCKNKYCLCLYLG